MAELLPTPSTELEAVNRLLQNIGESPVNSLSGQLTNDVTMARTMLHQVSRDVQIEGWHFNTERNFTLVPDSGGYINLPGNTLEFSLEKGYNWGMDVAQRGLKLYDRVNHTYRFDTDLIARLVLFLPFDEMPEAARLFVTMVAMRMHGTQTTTSEEIFRFTMEDEMRARAKLINAQGLQSKHNILNKVARDLASYQ